MTARPWVGPGLLAGVSVGLSALVGALGDSAATPGLGPATAAPPWDAAARPGPWLVTGLLGVAVLAGAAAVLGGLRALRAGHLLPGRAVAVAAVAAIGVLVLVPPVGSADHLSYAAYGRIAAAGDDPWTAVPIAWRGGRDPVAGAVQPPWQRTPSVYGPVATAAQVLAADLGHGALRSTVRWWQLLCGTAFALVGALLAAEAGPGPAGAGRRSRAAVLWTLNPLLLGQLVLGAHVDVLAVALGAGGLALAARRPAALPAGVLLGAAAGTKAPYALFGLAALWTLRSLPWRRALPRAGGLAAGAAAVLVPAYAWAGPHALDQLGRAGRFTSLATPWRAVADLGDLLLGRGALAGWLTPLALVLAALLAAGLGRALPDTSTRSADGARAALALTAAWVLVAPYALPWYDAMVWAPLALAAPSALDGLLLGRLAVLALAYVPGRVVGLTGGVGTVTLAVRTYVAPVPVLAVIVAVAVVARRGVSGAAVRGPRPPRRPRGEWSRRRPRSAP